MTLKHSVCDFHNSSNLYFCIMAMFSYEMSETGNKKCRLAYGNPCDPDVIQVGDYTMNKIWIGSHE